MCYLSSLSNAFAFIALTVITLPNSLRVKLYWGALAALALVAALSATSKQLGSSTRLKGDAHLIANVGQRILAGENVYANPLPDEPYPYPPGIALLFAPFGFFAPQTFVPLLATLNLAFAALSFLLLCDFFAGKSFFALDSSLQLALSFFTLLLALRFLLYELSSGQINLLVMTLTIYGLCKWQRQKAILGGFWIGLAMAIKLLTLPLGLWFALKRDFKTLGGIVLGAVVWLLFPSLFLGIGHNLELLRSWISIAVLKNAPVSGAIPFHDVLINHADNISLQALILRLTTDVVAFTHDGEPFRATIVLLPPALVSALKVAAVALVLSLAPLYAFLFRRCEPLVSEQGGIALALALTPQFLPQTHQYHFLTLLPAYFYIVYLWRVVDMRDGLFLSAMIASFAITLLTSPDIVGWRAMFLTSAFGSFTLANALIWIAMFRAGFLARVQSASLRKASATV